MRKIIAILIAIIIGCSANCFAQGKIIRQPKTSNTSGPKSGYENGHEWIDLGLPSGTKWATCNIGGSSPFDTGDYFYRGEKNPDGVIYRDKERESRFTLAKYKNVNHPKELWGGRWRLPTKNEISELCSKSKIERIENNGMIGAKFIGPNGNSIILRLAGNQVWTWEKPSFIDSFGSYLTSTISDDNTIVILDINDVDKKIDHAGWCLSTYTVAMSIRPVYK